VPSVGETALEKERGTRSRKFLQNWRHSPAGSFFLAARVNNFDG